MVVKNVFLWKSKCQAMLLHDYSCRTISAMTFFLKNTYSRKPDIQAGSIAHCHFCHYFRNLFEISRITDWQDLASKPLKYLSQNQ